MDALTVRKFCPRCELPKVGSSTRELIDWFKRVGRLEALKEVREDLRRGNASEVILSAINHAIREEERSNGRD